MSLSGVRRRFQKDVTKMNQALRAQQTKQNNRFVLPTFEQKINAVPSTERKTALTEIGLAPGDLVYITEGKHKGKISTVFQYTAEFDSVYLSDITEKKIVPPLQWFDQQQSHLIDYPDQIPKSHVRLAAKDVDSKGKQFYIVADDIVYKEKYYDDRYKQWLPKRFIKHHDNIEVPWPSPPREAKDGALSTNEEVALEKTFEFQSLAVPPVPKAALAQLRNPYSKHKAKVLSERDVRKLTPPSMPLTKEQKIYLAKQADKPKKEVKDLPEEVKDFIGERIASHLNKIENPYLKIHLEALSKSSIPDFEKTKRLIEETQKLNKEGPSV